MDLFSAKTWANYDAPGLNKERLSAIVNMIPSDVSTILDAGCGNGDITNALRKDYQITGLDFSAAALQHVQTSKVLASITAMPFKDKAFDLVICNEVLEHLCSSDLHHAISEMKRCAGKYLLISVPNNEQLEHCLVKCHRCNGVFHAYGHCQSFDQSRLDKLVNLPRLKHHTVGPKVKWINSRLLRMRQRRLNQWFSPQFSLSCPVCGGEEFINSRSLLTKLVNLSRHINFSAHRYWLMAFYLTDHK